MNITITRNQSTQSGTPGKLVATNSVGKTFSCDTLELPWNGNEPGVSCIIDDSYGATIWHSDHLDCDVLRLEDKHGRQNCLIHCGNFAGDAMVGLETQVHGCTLVGDRFGTLVNDERSSQLAILNSRLTLEKLILFVGGGEHLVQYQWDQLDQWALGCSPSSNISPNTFTSFFNQN